MWISPTGDNQAVSCKLSTKLFINSMKFVDEFPMTVTGKIQKFVIRQQEIQRRGLEQAASVETA